MALIDVQVSGAHLQIKQALQERLKHACNYYCMCMYHTTQINTFTLPIVCNCHSKLQCIILQFNTTLHQ